MRQRGALRGSTGAWRIDNDGVGAVKFRRCKRGGGEIGLAAGDLRTPAGKIGRAAQRFKRRKIHFDSAKMRQGGQERQAQRAASGKEVDDPRCALKKGGNILLQRCFGLAGRLEKSTRGRGHGDVAEAQDRRRRGQQCQRRSAGFADRQPRQTGLDTPGGKGLQQPVMPAWRPAQQKADAIVEPVRPRLDFESDGKCAPGKLGKPFETALQFRRENAAAKRCHNALRAAFKKPGGDAAGQPLEVKAGAATAVARRDMRRQDRPRHHPGAGKEAVDLVLFPGGHGLVLQCWKLQPPQAGKASQSGSRRCGEAVRISLRSSSSPGR